MQNGEGASVQAKKVREETNHGMESESKEEWENDMGRYNGIPSKFDTGKTLLLHC